MSGFESTVIVLLSLMLLVMIFGVCSILKLLLEIRSDIFKFREKIRDEIIEFKKTYLKTTIEPTFILPCIIRCKFHYYISN